MIHGIILATSIETILPTMSIKEEKLTRDSTQIYTIIDDMEKVSEEIIGMILLTPDIEAMKTDMPGILGLASWSI